MVDKESDKATESVRCLIVPADPGFMVIPSAAVAEIVPLLINDSLAEGNLLGFMSWRGLEVPVYTHEGMIGGDIPEFGKRSKAFIFYPWKGAKKDLFFAIAIKHDPRPRLLTSEDIKSNDEEQAENDFIRSSFLYDGEIAVIPDLQAISLQQQ
ncbi:MAG: chemotaxis protein CheW [Gammaproteobacteria bacterium]|nr:chemotaxis protein CheW [Gammaproteobacteria bacterium]